MSEDLALVDALISQDIYDFKCCGNMISEKRKDRFFALLKEYSKLSKEHTKQWQKENGYL